MYILPLVLIVNQFKINYKWKQLLSKSTSVGDRKSKKNDLNLLQKINLSVVRRSKSITKCVKTIAWKTPFWDRTPCSSLNSLHHGNDLQIGLDNEKKISGSISIINRLFANVASWKKFTKRCGRFRRCTMELKPSWIYILNFYVASAISRRYNS